MKYSRPRGTQDILPPDVYTWTHVEGVFWAALERYGYEPVRTPVFETTDLFLRSVGEGTDIVSKEMYTFTDRGGRSLTLRPENTAAVIRAYLENGMHRLGGVQRLAYIGPMFRYDRPQAGRYRQFHQVGAEAIGSMNPIVDVEIIDVVVAGLEDLHFENLSVKLNSVGCSVCRPPFLELLSKSLDSLKNRLCDDCAERAIRNPLRIFDCKKCEDIKRELPPITDHLCEECRNHFASVRAGLDALDRQYAVDALLVRGLDYYTKTAFEILHGELGAQNALCGGGRYDDLVEQCGGPSTPAVGFSAGLERIVSVLPESSRRGVRGTAGVDVYIACVDESASAQALVAAGHLRAKAASVEVDPTGRALKKQLKAAERSGARFTLIIADGDMMWKNMETREQVEVTAAGLDALADKHFGAGRL
jgi:histidyl-tRNA synthetase